MHPTAQKVVDAAHHLGLAIEIKEFESGTRTAEEAAHAVGCMMAQIVKSLLFIVGTQPTMALVSGSNRLDERKLANLCGVGRKQVKRSTADMARTITHLFHPEEPCGRNTTYQHNQIEPEEIDGIMVLCYGRC